MLVLDTQTLHQLSSSCQAPLLSEHPLGHEQPKLRCMDMNIRGALNKARGRTGQIHGPREGCVMPECRLPANCGLHCQRCTRHCTPFAEHVTIYPCRCRRTLLRPNTEPRPRILSRVPLIIEDGEGLAWPVEPIQVRGGWTWWVPRTPYGGEIFNDDPEGRQAALEVARRCVKIPVRSQVRHDVLYPDWLETMRPPRPPL